MKVTRRKFGLGLSATLLAGKILAPFARDAAAGTPNVAKRLVVFFTPNGTIHRFWRPEGADASFTFPAGSIPGELGVTPLQFGVGTGAWGATNQTRMSYSAPGVFVDPEDDPVQAYQSMFATAALPAAQVNELLLRRKSILDTVTADILDLRGRVGAEQRVKLDAHLSSLRTTERGLAATGGGCAAPARPASLAAHDNDNFPAIGKTQMDLLVTALACGLTTVASIQFAHTVSPHVFTWLTPKLSAGHHDLSHSDDSNASGMAAFVQAERWYSEQFAYLVSQLGATPEPGGSGTLLDNTLVAWVKELGDGRLHDGVSVPFVLAGRAGGFLTPGRYLKFGGTSHQAILVSLCQGMGLPIAAFGDPQISTGPLPGLA